MRRFGASYLSDRAAEVARLILRWHSLQVIARLLGNSQETVKMLRNRIGKKMGLATLAEVLSLFLAVLSVAPQGCADDQPSHLATSS